MNSFESLSYPQRQRLQFIESVAYWEGMIQRPRVSRVFEVSENHITRDITWYRKAFPGSLDYDPSLRAYRPGLKFKPRICTGSPEEYLSLLRTYVESQSVAVVPSIDQGVTATCLPMPPGMINKNVLRDVTRALSLRTGIQVRYQSLRSGDASERTIWPHVLVFDGIRWHVRAYDQKRGEFLDFVLQRILETGAVDDVSPRSPAEDKDWVEELEAEVVPAKRLSDTQSAVIAKQFGMLKEKGGWVWRVRVRKCLIPYFLHWLRLDLNEKESFPITLRGGEDLLALKFKHGDL